MSNSSLSERKALPQQERQPYPGDWALQNPARNHPAVSQQQQPESSNIKQQQEQQIQM